MEIFDNRNIAMSAYFVVMFVIPRSGAVAFHATVS
jgi:hypothetical protein